MIRKLYVHSLKHGYYILYILVFIWHLIKLPTKTLINILMKY